MAFDHLKASPLSLKLKKVFQDIIFYDNYEDETNNKVAFVSKTFVPFFSLLTSVPNCQQLYSCTMNIQRDFSFDSVSCSLWPFIHCRKQKVMSKVKELNFCDFIVQFIAFQNRTTIFFCLKLNNLKAFLKLFLKRSVRTFTR